MPPVCKIIASTYSGKYEKSCMCLYNTDKKKDRNRNLFRSGDPPEIRTPDTLLKRQVLCLLS